MIAPDERDRPPATLGELKPAQLAVCKLIAQAKENKQIAAILGISDRQVRYHVEALAYLLHCDPGCNTRVQIAMWWRERCPISLDGEAA
jgi:DNA-binding NarL/FixJ family response regulator